MARAYCARKMKNSTPLDDLMSVLADNPERIAISWRWRSYTYQWLSQSVAHWECELEALGVQPGAVVALEGNFSPNAVALLLALARRSAITLPVARELNPGRKDSYYAIAQPQ